MTRYGENSFPRRPPFSAPTFFSFLRRSEVAFLARMPPGGGPRSYVILSRSFDLPFPVPRPTSPIVELGVGQSIRTPLLSPFLSLASAVCSCKQGDKLGCCPLFPVLASPWAAGQCQGMTPPYLAGPLSRIKWRFFSFPLPAEPESPPVQSSCPPVGRPVAGEGPVFLLIMPTLSPLPIRGGQLLFPSCNFLCLKLY